MSSGGLVRSANGKNLRPLTRNARGAILGVASGGPGPLQLTLP